MLYLLRKIRRKLLTNNKVGTYLLYAIGEVTLVVVGILIAVSLDNLNKEKEADKMFQSTLEQIKLDLQRNIDDSQYGVLHGIRKDSLANYMLLGSPSPEVFRDPKAYPLIRLFNDKRGSFFHTTVGYDQLKGLVTENNLPDSLKNEMDNYYSGFQKYALSVHDDFDVNISDYTTFALKNYPWYSELKFQSLYDTISSDHAESLAHDPYIKNYIYQFQRLNLNSVRVSLFNAHLATLLYQKLAAFTGQEQIPAEVTQWRKTISTEDKEMLSGTYKSNFTSNAFTIFDKNGTLLFEEGDFTHNLFKLTENIYINLSGGDKCLLFIQDTDPVTISFSAYPVPLYKKIAN